MSGGEVLLRPATADDTPVVTQIWASGWRDGHLGHVQPALVAVRTRETFASRAAARVDDTVVAEVDGVVAGFVMTKGAEVEQVYVAAEHRGSGVAGTLLAAAEEQIRRSGHAAAWLAVVAGNARARRFYERCGWSDEGPFDYPAPDLDEPITVRCHRYVKPLTR